MGKKEKEVKRVVLDTNILVSALLFHGDLSKIVDLWKKGSIIPVVSRETFEEFKNVFSYHKFSLTEGEIKIIIEEKVLPFFEIVDITHEIRGVCRDSDDDKFLSCAVSASADFVVSGDKDLSDLAGYKSVKIITPAKLLKMF
ncbi:MAG: putative toxin-antitoxin system toxin component, PIN family [Nitrospirota bacterium]